MSTTQPFFSVVLHRNGEWVIEAEWPDGSIEPIDTFGEHFEALNWITNRAAAWTEQRARSKAAGSSWAVLSLDSDAQVFSDQIGLEQSSMGLDSNHGIFGQFNRLAKHRNSDS